MSEEGNQESNHALPKIIPVSEVVIHPLVLLSAADHYHRVAKNTRKRVVGAVLGQVSKGLVEATNSFAVPFEEDLRNPAVFYFDHDYVESMVAMFRKINAKERILGFYSTGPELRPNDLRIHATVSKFTSLYAPVFLIIDIRPNRPDLPVRAYQVQEQTFQHVPVAMGALEAEEIGVEHLLRDIHDPTVSTVASRLQAKFAAVATLHEKLLTCRDYLRREDASNWNPEIISNCQSIVALLPNLEPLGTALTVQSNDMHLSMYLGSLIRSVVALHDLISNKIKYGTENDMVMDGVGEDEAEEKKEETEVKTEVKT